MKKRSHHVVPDSHGGWNAKKAGCSRASAHTQTKLQAVNIARQISRNINKQYF